MRELPIYDGRGGALLSYRSVESGTVPSNDAGVDVACAIVVVRFERLVLLGFNVARQGWELPGGSLEDGETAEAAARRELAEETGLALEVTLVALATFAFGAEERQYDAAVFVARVATRPRLVESDELSKFGWWIPSEETWDDMSPLDAEVARRCADEQSRDSGSAPSPRGPR